MSGFTVFQLPIFRISVAILSNSKYDSNCLEQVEALADETVRTGFRCEQSPSAQLIFMVLRIVSVKVLNRYSVKIVNNYDVLYGKRSNS